MDFKKIRKETGRFLSWMLLHIVLFIINFLPGRWLYGFAQGFARLGFVLARKHRRIAMESLAVAFGSQKSEREIEEIARNCFIFMAKSAIELFFLMERPALFRQRVEIIGKNNLDAALARGKGVILVSAHFGNFPLMLGKFCLEGYTTSAIMRHMRDPRTERTFVKKRSRYSLKTIYSQPRKECVEQTIKALRNNELVFIPMDQNFGTAGVFVDFFGKKAATATGPVILAQRTQSSLLPCFIIRQKDDTHKIICEPALELEQGKRDQASVITVVQKLTNIIEAYIRKYPAEWSWIHRRWKSRPNVEKGGH